MMKTIEEIFEAAKKESNLYPSVTIDNLEDLIQSYFDSYEINKENYTKNKDLSPYLFLLELDVAYSIRFYEKISNIYGDKNLFPWINDVKRMDEKKLLIILNFKQLVNYKISIYKLFTFGLESQSKVLMRTYIETSALLFLLITDFDFLEEYESSKSMKSDDYLTKWFKQFKHKKIKSKIAKYQTDVIKSKVLNIAKLNKTNIFLSTFLENIYNHCSDASHSRPNFLFAHNFCKENKGFRIHLRKDWSRDKRGVLVNIIELFNHTQNLLESYLDNHNTIWSEKRDLELSLFYSMFHIECITKGDLYEFAKQDDKK